MEDEAKKMRWHELFSFVTIRGREAFIFRLFVEFQ